MAQFRPERMKQFNQELVLFLRECVLGLVSGESFGEGGGLVELTGLQGVEILVGLQLASDT